MFINPKHAIDQGWIKFPDWMTPEQQQRCVQPNAIDFTLDRLFVVDSSSPAEVTEKSKIMRQLREVTTNSNNQWVIESNQLYDGMSDFYVNVPDNVASLLVVRSTFNRVGIQLNSGLYDSFFSGNAGFTLFNRSGPLVTEPHTRIGQIIFVEADAAGRYAGGYNTAAGQHWAAST